MKCSDCSRVVRPIVATDIDGTMGGYHPHFTKFAELYLARKLPSSYDGFDPFWAYLGLDLATYRQVKLAYRQGGLKRSMPLLPGAFEMFNRISLAGAEIWVTTTRPYLRLDNIDPDTQFWLEQSGMKPDFMLYDEDKYGQLNEHVDPGRVVGVVDDLPEQLDRADELFGPVSLQPEFMWTSGVHRGPTAATLGVVADKFCNRIQQWYKERA